MSIRASVSAQRLNAFVRWERNERVDTASAGTRDNWRTLITSRAAVDGMTDVMRLKEDLIEGGIRTPKDYTVWIRSDVFTRFRLTELDRGIWIRPSGDTILNILAIPDQGLAGRLIGVFCRSGLNAG